MNKETFSLVLNVALLNYVDGMNEKDISYIVGDNHKVIQAGLKLSQYLQTLNLEVQK